MTQQSHSWAYTPRKPDLKETHAPQCSSQHCDVASRTWKQPRCPLADKWIRKLWYICTMEYYSAVTKNAFESVLMRWMKPEPITQSEVSKKEKKKDFKTSTLKETPRKSKNTTHRLEGINFYHS